MKVDAICFGGLEKGACFSGIVPLRRCCGQKRDKTRPKCIEHSRVLQVGQGKALVACCEHPFYHLSAAPGAARLLHRPDKGRAFFQPTGT